MRRCGNSAAKAFTDDGRRRRQKARRQQLRGCRIWLVRIEPQRLDRRRELFLGILAFAGQFDQRGQGDVLGIDLEEAAQFLPGLAAAEAVAAEDDVGGGIRDWGLGIRGLATLTEP